MPIERAFALLKGRWRKLKYVNIAKVVDIPNIVIAACVLHNICLMIDDDFEDFIEVNNEQEVNNFDNFETPHEQASDKRNRIRQHLPTV